MCKRELGFTLVELLVVLAILVVLVAMLLPSFRGVMEYGWDIKCKSNLHNLSQALRQADPTGAICNTRRWMQGLKLDKPEATLICPKGCYLDDMGGFAVSAGITEIPAPPSMQHGLIESKTDVFSFVERLSYRLPYNLHVNISKAGRHDHNYNSTGTMIPAGTIVDSYYMFFDPTGSVGAIHGDRWMKFPGPILGVICLTATLDASDKILGAPGTKYPTGNSYWRGFEDYQEVVSIPEDMRTFTVHGYNSPGAFEHARIITEQAEPQVGSYAMNPQVDPQTPRNDQILLVEYDQCLIDVESPDHAALVQPRHFDKVNVLLVDGSVKALEPHKLDADNEIYHP